MKSLLIVCDESQCSNIAKKIEETASILVLRFDLAWELFLGKEGKNEAGQLDIPAGNPRTKWFSLNQWVRQSLGSAVDMIHTEHKQIAGIISSCTPAALEYVSRMLSIYSSSSGLLQMNAGETDSEEAASIGAQFFQTGTHPFVSDNWRPPIANISAAPTPLLQKTSKVQDGGEFTWLTGILGSDRLFAQVYRLKYDTGANRLHSHSDVDEMFVVLEGSGSLMTEQGEFPLIKGDVISKPAGSGLATKLIAGAEGMTILDIEAWTRSDQTDIVVYPQHREVFLRGRGLDHVTAIENYLPGSEMMKQYTKEYKREKDGTATE
ncbi:cupin domain-containing protein [Aneurinibacillus tyrosinisolvens]|uniref:cupin domain-containing protein n=1 Tax=Aneurinibacillus tyrosinisolvens TaxID=1443435 RepID=UPI00069BE8A2|nr:hypothetical protein [Aneurinibacillus tyrosinisolvens]